jgi:predicted secreted protein
MASTSPIAAAIAVEGLLLQMGNGASPEVFTTVANVTDFTMPVTADTVEVTNVGDAWKRRIPTLLDMGKVKFKIYWVMTETTHRAAVTTAIRGLRYILLNSLLTSWKIIYPDGLTSTDYFAAFVTSFSITGKTGGVFEAEIELSNDNNPILI